MNYTRNSNYLSSWAGRAHTFLAGRYFLSNSQLPQDARFSAWQSLACLFTGRLTSRRAAGLGTTSLLEGEDRAVAGSQHISVLFPARRWAACVVPKSAASCASLSPFALCVNYIPAKCYNVCSLICFLTGEGGEAHKEISKLRGESIGGKSCVWASTLHTRGRHGRKHSHSLCWCPASVGCSSLTPFLQRRKKDTHFLFRVLSKSCRLMLPWMSLPWRTSWTLPVAQWQSGSYHQAHCHVQHMMHFPHCCWVAGRGRASAPGVTNGQTLQEPRRAAGMLAVRAAQKPQHSPFQTRWQWEPSTAQTQGWAHCWSSHTTTLLPKVLDCSFLGYSELS